MTLATGHQLGAYKILDRLGSGGMGEVYRAWDPRLGREVAVKVIRQDLAHDPVRLARFDREAKLLAALNHPNVAAVYGFEEDFGTRFLVMELVHGQTLAEQVKQGPLPLYDAMAICGKVAEALEAAHGKEIIHRDLKPANIMLTAENHVKVLDFGLAKPTDVEHSSGNTISSDGVVLGSPAYMSPEQARGKSLDKTTDVWSFACILFELLSGRRAFDGETASDVIATILSGEPDWTRLPRSTPVRVINVLRLCLNKDSDRRLADIRQARLEIEKSLRELPAISSTSVPFSAATTLTPWAFRSKKGRRVLEALSALCLIALAVIVFYVLILRSEIPPTEPSVQPVPTPNSLAILVYYPNELNMAADRLQTSITYDLSQSSGLRVTPPELASRSKDENAEPAAAGRKLGAGTVLAIRLRAADTISVDLIDAEGNFMIWGKQISTRGDPNYIFSNPSRGIFTTAVAAKLDDISREISNEVRTKLAEKIKKAELLTSEELREKIRKEGYEKGFKDANDGMKTLSKEELRKIMFEALDETIPPNGSEKALDKLPK